MIPDPRRSRRAGFPAALVAALGLIATIELSLNRCPQAWERLGATTWRLAARSARVDAPGCEVLALGDSLILHAVQPAVLETRLEGRAFNLAAAAAPPQAAEVILRQALDAGARPRALCVEFAPFLWPIGPARNRSNWAVLPGVGVIARLARDAGSPAFAADLMLRKLLISYRDRDEIRRLIDDWTAGQRGSPVIDNGAATRHHARNRGAFCRVSGGGPAAGQGAIDLIPENLVCQPSNQAAMERLLETAEQYDITVYWLLTPFEPGFMRLWRSSGAESRERHFVRSLQRRFNSLVVVDGRDSQYPSGVFLDAVHLAASGGRALSDDLARILTMVRPNDDRWIDLPAYRDKPVEQRGESFERSLAIVNEGMRRR